MKLYRINAMLLKYWYITLNRPDRIFDIIYWPVINLFVWGFASVFVKGMTDYNIVNMFMGGMVLWIFVWRSSQDIGVYILEDFWGRNLYHLFSSPVTLAEQMVSLVLFAFLRAVAAFLILTTVAYLFYAFNVFSLNPVFLAYAVAILSLFGFVVGLFVVSIILRYGQRIQVLAWSIVWVVQPFSCIFYPLSSLPGWAQAIAKVLPTTYVFESLRAVLSGKPFVFSDLGYSFILTAIFLVAVVVLLAASFRYAKSAGVLARGD